MNQQSDTTYEPDDEPNSNALRGIISNSGYDGAVREMPDTPYVTLAEAISWVGLRVSLKGDVLGRIVESGEYHALPNRLYPSMTDALSALLVKGIIGEVQFVGRYLTNYTGSAFTADEEPIEPIRLNAFGMYDHMHDGLERGYDFKLFHFNTLCSDGFKSVKVNRAQLLKWWPINPSQPLWTCDEMETWWKSEGFTNSKKARNAFMQRGNTNGMTSAFEACWREKHPSNKRGRPHVTKSPQSNM